VRRHLGLTPPWLAGPLREQPPQRERHVPHDLGGRGIDLVDVRHGVDVQDRRGEPPRRDELYGVEPGGHDQVGARQQVPDHPVPGHVQDAREVRVCLADHALGHRADDDRHPGPLRQGRERHLRTAAHRTAAHQQHRSSRRR